MKADISLSERRALEREQQAEIRAALVRCHFLDTLEEMEVDAALVRLEIEQLQSFAPVIKAMRARNVGSAAPATVVIAEFQPIQRRFGQTRLTCRLTCANVSDCNNHSGRHSRSATPH